MIWNLLTAENTTEGGVGSIIIMGVLVLAIIGLFVWQTISGKKKQKAAQDMVNSLKIGDRVIVERASIERGTHLHLPTMVTIANAGKYFAKDQELISAIVKGQYDYGHELITKPEIVILEFKILPVGEIHAAIEPTTIAVDPFRVNAAAN